MSGSNVVYNLPSRLIVTVGTYDGVIAGWELLKEKKKKNKFHDDFDEEIDEVPREEVDEVSRSKIVKKNLQLTFASPVHTGSVRNMCFASKNPNAGGGSSTTTKQQQLLQQPGSLLSCGYDEMIKTHDFLKRLTSSGEIRTPSDFGTPVCSSFAPPYNVNYNIDSTDQENNEVAHSTHCIVGFSQGKIVIYKKRDWSVQHVLNGHEGGISSLVVHPTGKMALSGGISDGKLKLWDLTKGRLSYVNKINTLENSSTSSSSSNKRHLPLISIVWSPDGSSYGFAYGTHITVRDVMSGKALLDVELPPGATVNEIAMMQGVEGLFVVAACNDGSLPVLAVNDIGSDDAQARRAIMAIEPVQDRVVAGEERFKCVKCVGGYNVVVANSKGIVYLMNLQGAINMITATDDDNDNDDEQNSENEKDSDEEDENDEEDDDDDGEEEMAVDIIDEVKLGTGARITCLVAWSCYQKEEQTQQQEEDSEQEGNEESDKDDDDEEEAEHVSSKKEQNNNRKRKSDDLNGRQQQHRVFVSELDTAEVKKARELVEKAKKIQKKKKHKKNNKKRKKSKE